MRVYLVIIDESQEAHGAMRFAARRAADTGGAVHLLALVPKQEFSAFGAVQETIEAEAHDRAEVLANSAAGELMSESGLGLRKPVVLYLNVLCSAISCGPSDEPMTEPA